MKVISFSIVLLLLFSASALAQSWVEHSRQRPAALPAPATSSSQSAQQRMTQLVAEADGYQEDLRALTARLRTLLESLHAWKATCDTEKAEAASFGKWIHDFENKACTEELEHMKRRAYMAAQQIDEAEKFLHQELQPAVKNALRNLDRVSLQRRAEGLADDLDKARVAFDRSRQRLESFR